jgi:hypothetical protein
MGNKNGLQQSLGSQSSILQARGDLDVGMQLLIEQEHICREIGNKDGLQSSLGAQAWILMNRGDLERSIPPLEEQERICHELGNVYGLATSLIIHATLLGLKMEQPQQALPLADEAYRLAASGGYKDLTAYIETMRAQIRQRLG